MSCDHDESVPLLDEPLIEEQRGIRREVQVGRRSGVLMEPDRDKPWDYCGPGMSRRIHLYGTVLYDDLVGKYRMWYMRRSLLNGARLDSYRWR